MGTPPLEGFGDGGGVDAPVEQLPAGVEQTAGDDAHGGGPVPGLYVLGLGQLHQHLGRRVQHLHLLQDRRSVVRDGDVTVSCKRQAQHPSNHILHPIVSLVGAFLRKVPDYYSG